MILNEVQKKMRILIITLPQLWIILKCGLFLRGVDGGGWWVVD